jgi:hypothetical protein
MPSEIYIELEANADFGEFQHNYANTGAPSPTLGTGNLPWLGISRNITFHPDARTHFGNWFRFPLPFKFEDEILEARLILYQHGEDSTPTDYSLYIMRLKAHDVDDGANPANHAEMETWSLPANMTTAEVQWEVPPFSISGAEVQSDDITAILREILDRAGWVKDNYITLISKTQTPFYTQASPPQEASMRFYRRNDPGGSATDGILLWVRYNEAPEGPGGEDRSVVHDLTIEQDINFQLLNEGVEHTLTFEQDIVYVITHNKSVEHELTIEQDINYVQTHEETVQHNLFIFQDIVGNRDRTMPIVEHTLTFEQDIHRYTNLDQEIRHTLTFEQDIEASYTYRKSVESELTFEQTIHQTPQQRSVLHVLVIEQEIDFDGTFANPQSVEHTLTFEQDIIAGGDRTRGVEHTLDIQQSVLGWLIDNTTLCVRADTAYSPQADATVSFPPEPVLAEQDVLLEYPPGAPTLSITLPRPLFGNREELTLTRIQRRTRGGDLKTFSAEEWAKVKVFRYKFDSLNDAKVEEFFSFLGQTLGLKVRLTDYEGRVWDGFIVNPDGESAQFFRVCGLTTQFDFDGVAV